MGVDITQKELTIYGSRNNLGRFTEAVGFVTAHPDLASTMVTHEYSFEQAIEAFEIAEAHPEQACKVILNLAP